MQQENSSEITMHYTCTPASCHNRPSSFATAKKGAESAHRHENGLSSPSQNALCSAFTRKKGAFSPGTLARPRPATEAPQRKGKLRWRYAARSRALALRPLSVAGRTRDAWLREKGFWPSFSPNWGERAICFDISSADSLDSREGLSA